ncbi:hypothetical protein [Burkholderia phage vB_BglM_WTB]
MKARAILRALILVVAFVMMIEVVTPALESYFGEPGVFILPFAWFGFVYAVFTACGLSLWEKPKRD